MKNLHLNNGRSGVTLQHLAQATVELLGRFMLYRLPCLVGLDPCVDRWRGLDAWIDCVD